MQAMSDSQKQVEELGPLLRDMQEYLYTFEQACQKLPVQFHAGNKAYVLDMLVKIMEGLHYYQKLLKSAAILLSIDFSECLYEKISVSLLLDQLCQNFNGILEAAENEDYSLLNDLVEYDLLSDIDISRQVLESVLRRYEERVV